MYRRFLLLCLALLAAARVAHAEELPPPPSNDAGVPPLLFDALTKVAQNFDRWAYTETTHVVVGKKTQVGIVRFDPSKPYAEQYQPISFDGKPPTERQLKDYRQRGEKRGDKLLKEEAEGKTPGSQIPRFNINGGSATIDLGRASVATEDANSVTYEVPLKNDGRATIPVDQFQLLARVNRQTHAFENVSLRLKGAIRMKLIVKIKTGEASVDFGPVDATHAPAVTSLTGGATASVLFLKFGGTVDMKRSDFKRVKPYGERFGVKIGPMKALNF
ncbi:MAG TPA: hypothetical protein PLU52_03610 [Opitutaceae bacterium]|nr:hypothetical protein [Opitutaceae bacterium]HND61539.1 hypothetical protein [Opitutaceae bacterium]